MSAASVLHSLRDEIQCPNTQIYSIHCYISHRHHHFHHSLARYSGVVDPLCPGRVAGALPGSPWLRYDVWAKTVLISKRTTKHRYCFGTSREGMLR